MKAIILAAGIGSRLRPMTDNVPKCMVEVNGIKIIEQQLKSLLKYGINEICVISGYKETILSEFLLNNFPTVTQIINKEYLTTNNMYSLYLANDFLKDDEFILMNADVFFDELVIKDVCDSNFEDLIVCQKDKYNDESMKVIVNNSYITKISKKVSKELAYGTSIDVYKFSVKTSKKLFEIISDIIINKGEKNMWTEVAIDQLLFNSSIKPLNIKYNWVEIDNYQDLELASNIF